MKDVFEIENIADDEYGIIYRYFPGKWIPKNCTRCGGKKGHSRLACWLNRAKKELD